MASVIRQILKVLMEEELLAEITWAGVSRTSENGKEINVALKSLKGVVRMILSKNYWF